MSKRIVELHRSFIRWHYVTIDHSGKVRSTSHKYFSKSKARQSAKFIAKILKAKYEEK